MPKSKRAKVFNLTQVAKKTRSDKEKHFELIRACVPQYQHLLIFSVDNMRNNHIKDVRRELKDCRIFFGKTKLAARALGTTPEDAQAGGLDKLAAHLSGSVGLLFTNRPVASVLAYLSSLAPADFARAGATAPRAFVVPPGPVCSTGGAVPAEHDVPVPHTLEPELRRLGMPVRLDRGRVLLSADEQTGEGYTVCRAGDVLDSRQTRLLKLFDQCLSEFRMRAVAYWTAATGDVTVMEPDAMEGVDETVDETAD